MSRFRCPLKGCVIEVPDEIVPTDIESLPTAIDIATANAEAVILMHFELHHTIKEFGEALGNAREALSQIHALVNRDPMPPDMDVQIDTLCHAGGLAGE